MLHASCHQANPHLATRPHADLDDAAPMASAFRSTGFRDDEQFIEPDISEMHAMDAAGFALFELARLADDVKRLREGLAPFDALSPAERAEQLAALSPDKPSALTAKDVAFIQTEIDHADEHRREVRLIVPLARRLLTVATHQEDDRTPPTPPAAPARSTVETLDDETLIGIVADTEAFVERVAAELTRRLDSRKAAA